MNPDSTNFNALKRLLALKRHEQPPPGYFSRFSGEVMARIKAGEEGDEIGQLPWFQHLLAMFDVKPVYAGVFGMAVCTLLISGVIASSTAPSVANTPSNLDNGNYIADVPPATSAAVPVAVSLMTGNSNAMASQPSLFDQLQPPNAQPISERYWVPSGN